MSAADCHRFLHTNYNTTDVAAIEAFYGAVFDMRSVMRSRAEETNSEAFGMYGLTCSETVFAYDHRGGRRAPSLEFVQWIEPPTFGETYPRPWDLGIQAVGFVVPDIDAVVAATPEHGGRVVHHGASVALLRDPEGVAVEVVEQSDATAAEFRWLRIVCRNPSDTADWYTELGIARTDTSPAIPGERFWPAEQGHEIDEEVVVAASDDPTFTLVLTSWSGDDPPGPTYGMPFHTGLYRMAVAVDDVVDAHASLAAAEMATQPPYTFALPGTPITEGLTIAFLRDPDDVLVELVERPRSFFTR